MYYIITQVLFWLYWLIAVAAILLVGRELFRTSNRIMQVTVVLTLIPLLLRVLLLK